MLIYNLEEFLMLLRVALLFCYLGYNLKSTRLSAAFHFYQKPIEK